MTPKRSQAYRRVMQVLRDKGPTKLHPREQQRIRSAADTLLFAVDPQTREMRGALQDMRRLAELLVSSGRWRSEEIDGLMRTLLACGPDAAPQRARAA